MNKEVIPAGVAGKLESNRNLEMGMALACLKRNKKMVCCGWNEHPGRSCE